MAGIGTSIASQQEANPIDPKKKKTLIEEKTNKSASPKKIIIGGAGIGGMCCGYELMKKGHEVVLLEASG